MEKKEKYIWIVIIAVALAAVAVIYLEFSTQPNSTIDVALKLSGNATARIYPYQSITVPLVVSNYGGKAFKGLGVGVFVNGTLAEVYNVSMPQHNSTQINYTKQFTVPGSFNISFEADPGMLYKISNRSESAVNYHVTVMEPDAPNPAEYLTGNWISMRSSYMNSAGYLTSSYLNANYSIRSLGLSDMPAVDAFFSPMLNLTYNYTQSIYSAEATYKNFTEYSMWIQGSLVGNIAGIWAYGLKDKNVTVSNATIDSNRVSVITLNSNTTLCSWYSGGWIKNLAYEGAGSCASVLNTTKNSTGNIMQQRIPMINGTEIIANFSGFSSEGNSSGVIFAASASNAISYVSEAPSMNPDYTCYGPITSADNVSYCSTVVLPVSGAVGRLSLVKTSAYVGSRNLTVMSLVNTSSVTKQSYNNIAILQKLNVSGANRQFISGINSTCGFNASVSCYSPVLAFGNMSMKLYNKLNQNIRISSMYCYSIGSPIHYPMNSIIPANDYANVTVPCYDNGNTITGLPIGLTLKIGMNYSIANRSFTAGGSAYVV
ncbi:MAG: hypothetical protein M1156_00810 [Candidatus Marsarchaeota archaeon]|nr:hypothetical protein [Candidatus Marsarchaeota archaeon]